MQSNNSPDPQRLHNSYVSLRKVPVERESGVRTDHVTHVGAVSELKAAVQIFF